MMNVSICITCVLKNVSEICVKSLVDALACSEACLLSALQYGSIYLTSSKLKSAKKDTLANIHANISNPVRQ